MQGGGMSNLANLQSEFTQAIFNPQRSANAPIFRHILAKEGPDERERLEIYRSAIFSSFTRVLVEVFPVIVRLLGDDFFSAMARLYALEYPSVQPDLNQYGKQLPEFIEQFEPLKEMPYLVDVARLEWHWHELFYASDSPPFDFSHLATVDESEYEKVAIRLPYAARLLHSHYPAKRIWDQNQPRISEPDEIDLNEGEDYLIIWRSGYERRIEKLSSDQWLLLQSVGEGVTLANLIAQPNLEAEIYRLLPDCVQRGWLTNMKID
jgi:hypothetical protein